MKERRFLGFKRTTSSTHQELQSATARSGTDYRGEASESGAYRRRQLGARGRGREERILGKWGPPAGAALVFASSTRSIHGGRERESTGTAVDCLAEEAGARPFF
jgi:hypothetical protein